MWKIFTVIVALCMFSSPMFAAAHTQLSIEESCEREKKAWVQYKENMLLGIELGCKLRGIKISEKQRAEICKLLDEVTPKVATRLDKLGVYEEWQTQLLDPHVVELNQQAFKCESLEQLKTIANNQTEYFRKKYPRLMAVVEQDKELQALCVRLLYMISTIIQ